MWHLIKKTLNIGFKNLAQDGGLAAATVFILVITISVITCLYVLGDVSSYIVNKVQEKVDVSVYFKDSVLEEDILKVRDKVEDIAQVKSVAYVSKEKALELFTLEHADDAVLMGALAEVGVNPFLAALNIKAYEADQFSSVASFLEGGSYSSLIEKVDYHQRKGIIDRIFSITSSLYVLGIVVSLLLVIIAVLVAFNTIRLTIYSNREEIKIQRLVGASNWFIRGPFVAQGVISGLFAAFVCFFLLFVVSFLLGSRLDSLFAGLNLFSFVLANWFVVLVLQLVVGVSLGVVSSLIAVRKYLDV